MEQFESIPVRTLFSGTMQVLDRLSKTSSPTERAALRRAMATLGNALPRAEREQTETVSTDTGAQLHLAGGIVEPKSSESGFESLGCRPRGAATSSGLVSGRSCRAGRYFRQHTAQRRDGATSPHSHNDHAPPVGA